MPRFLTSSSRSTDRLFFCMIVCVFCVGLGVWCCVEKLSCVNIQSNVREVIAVHASVYGRVRIGNEHNKRVHSMMAEE
jgi:hypothetical protein